MGAKTNGSLPQAVLTGFDVEGVKQIVSKVVAHYRVPIGFMALESPEAVHLKACHGTAIKKLNLGGLACHHIDRAIPIIIDDAQAEQRYRSDPLVTGPRVRFCVGAPLMLKPQSCVGVLWIMDPELHPGFSIDDCALLVQATQEIMDIYRTAEAAADLWKFSIGTTEALPEVRCRANRAALARPLCPPVRELGTKSNGSLPEVALQSFDAGAVLQIVARAIAHYSVPMGFLALEGPDSVHLKARHGTSLRQVGLGGLACHHINRPIPIIIDDAQAARRYESDPLVTGAGVRFCVGAPLMLRPQTCVGVFWIMDPELHPGFSIDDCAFLVEATHEIMAIYRAAEAAGDLWKLSIGTVDMLPELRSRAADRRFSMSSVGTLPEDASDCHGSHQGASCDLARGDSSDMLAVDSWPLRE